MTIRVKTPDGSSFSFPDGTSQDEITGALDAHFGGAQSAAPAAPAEPRRSPGEKLQSFGENVTPQGPISGILALARLAGKAYQGKADLMTDEGINRAIPSVVEGSVAAAPSARSPVRVPRVPELPSEPVVNTPSAASPTPVTSMWDKVKAAAPYILAETLTSTHGAPGMGSLAVASAKHFMSKSISDALRPPEAATAAPPEAAPSFSTLTPMQRAAPPPEGPMAPPSFLNGEALAKARQDADVMNLLYRLKQQNTPTEPAPVAAVKAQTQAEAVTPPSEGLRVAIKKTNGTVFTGQKGELHFDLGNRVGIRNDDRLGFVTPAGEYLTRQQALDWANAKQGLSVKPDAGNEGFLHAINYNEAQRRASASKPETPAPAEYAPIASGHGEKSPAEMMDYRIAEMRRRGTLFNEAGYSKAVAAKATVQDQMARGLANDVPELGMTKAEILDHIRSETNQAQAEQLANYWANKVPAKAGRIREVFSATNLRAGWSKRGKAR